jgi:hypothetical protein
MFRKVGVLFGISAAGWLGAASLANAGGVTTAHPVAIS